MSLVRMDSKLRCRFRSHAPTEARCDPRGRTKEQSMVSSIASSGATLPFTRILYLREAGEATFTST